MKKYILGLLPFVFLPSCAFTAPQPLLPQAGQRHAGQDQIAHHDPGKNKQKLIFVYNADSGIFSVVTDFAHKTLAPDTYQCNLCKLTHGTFTMRKEWKDFLEQLPYQLEFLHKDEFIKKFPQFKKQEFPTVLMLKDEKLADFISKDQINRQKDLPGLIALFKEKLQIK